MSKFAFTVGMAVVGFALLSVEGARPAGFVLIGVGVFATVAGAVQLAADAIRKRAKQ